MQNNLTELNQDSKILADIKPDMNVYDRDGEKVGEVDRIHFAEGHKVASADAAKRDDRDIVTKTIQDLFSSEDDLPEELRGQLARHGFITVNANPLTRTYLIIPEAIERVADGEVRLNRAEAELTYK